MEIYGKQIDTEFLVNRFGETATREIARLIKELMEHNTTYESSENKVSEISENDDTDKYPSSIAVQNYSEKKTNIVTTNTTSLTAEVNNYYRFDNAVETLAITLPAMSDTTVVKTIVFYLTGGTSPNVTFTSTAPSGGTAPAVYAADGFSIESGNTYEINALWNGSAWIVTYVEILIQ